MNILRYKQRAMGHHFRCADAPDTSAQNAIAASNVALSAEQLAWAKDIYRDTAPERAAATSRAAAVSDAQLAALAQQTAIAGQSQADYNATYRPIEQKLATTAQQYDTPERRAAAAAAAGAGVEANVSAQRDASARAMSRMGVDPSSGKALGLQANNDIAAAAAKAGASNLAERNVETVGAAKMADAANLGRNIASSQATSAQLALSQGNAAAANAQGASTAALTGTNVVQGAYGTALSGNTQAAGIYANVAQQQAQANSSSSGLFGGLGAAAGAIGGQYAGSAAGSAAITNFLSDENAKEDIKPRSGKKSMAQLRAIEVSDWKYKDGMGDGGQHTGPMAQDVQAAAGDSAAPGGTSIDPITMNGITIGAVKDIDSRLKKLEAKGA